MRLEALRDAPACVFWGVPGCWALIQAAHRSSPHPSNIYLVLWRQVATLIVLLFGVGGAAGVIGGGALGQWLYKRKKVRRCWLGSAREQEDGGATPPMVSFCPW